MSTTKHTSGPWFVNGPFDEPTDLFIRATVDGENFDLANLQCDETGQHDANAKLIAAAPDLLKQLIDLVETVENIMGCSFWEHSEDDDRLLMDAKAAIKKATAN
jgi:hypothetical protein